MKSVLARSVTVGLLLVTLLLPQFSATILGADAAPQAEEWRDGESVLEDHNHGHDVDSSEIELGLAEGSEGPAVTALQHYLEMAGYLSMETITEGVFDAETAGALEKFQRRHRLDTTSMVDQPTLDLMGARRFDDLPDFDDDPDGGRSLAYTTRNYWTNTNLTYAFDRYTSDVSQAAQRAAVRDAFDTWMAVTPLVITEVGSTSSADLVVSFESGEHGDPCSCAFDGRGGVLAHAYYPPPNGGRIAGDTHFDDAENWTLSIPVPAGGIDLKTVAIHEFGHALGLGHSGVRGAIMYPYYSGIDHDLHSDDIAGIQSLYGANTTGGGGGGNQVFDAEIVSITASPSSLEVGAQVSGSVVVRNAGENATIPVTITGPAGYAQSLSTGNLGPGQSQTLSFAWTATAAGSFTFTATSSLDRDQNSANDSKTSNAVTVTAPQQQIIDAEVSSASASPASITKNAGNVTITAAVKNNGSASASVPVSVSGPNGWTASKTVSVGAGGSATVQFAWPASVAGTHTFTVTTALSGDQQSGNNSRATNAVTVNEPAPAPGALHVAGIEMEQGEFGGRYYLRANISVGPSASAANGALVYGYWKYPTGQSRFGYGYADSTGRVKIQLVSPMAGEHQFLVYRVNKSGHAYDASLNQGNPGIVVAGGETPPADAPSVDAGVNSVTVSPANLELNAGNVTISATVANNSASPANVPVTINGPNGFSEARTVTISGNASAQVSFSWPASVAGNHNFSVKTDLAGDENTANDQRTSPGVSVTENAPDVVDAGITSFSRSTSSAEKDGTAVTFTASVRNYGNAPADVTVRLKSGSAGVDTTQTVALAAGASKSVQFSWDPSVVGQHTFEVAAELSGDSNAANDSRTTSLTVTEKVDVASEIFVERIRAIDRSYFWYVYVYVDSTGTDATSGARVTIEVSAGGQTSEYSGSTNSRGYAVMRVSKMNSSQHKVTVQEITLSDHTYAPSRNKVSSLLLP